MQEYHFKILVVGEQACGKTCILHRYIKDVFLDQLKMTVGVDFTVKQIKWDDSTLLRLQFWDIAGQERYGHMTPVCAVPQLVLISPPPCVSLGGCVLFAPEPDVLPRGCRCVCGV